MKTIRQWFDTFPEYYRDRAISALNEQPLSEKGECVLYGNAKLALNYAFVWDCTPEGHDFWSRFNKQLNSSYEQIF